ncbi:SH3 domain-containing protein [Lyngbya confervoides]|uniref:SH3 domain-containing protein n=1 Tax=Lyngbya confervoides BDU141951 TaxID=1574623 RepID=A0ABD4T6M0_9CYAN|nr:SH3 domain-containing protein [Lyngbya confervoides]MCM1984143.1 SH3 domain-containing protein [Lyngbya confervoides BDU141951]
MKRKVTFTQFSIGLVLGLLVVLSVIVGVGYLYFLRLSTSPPKPEFPEVKPPDNSITAPGEVTGSSDSSYVALVIYPDGLILRELPEASAPAITTIQFEETVRVLERSEDEQWEKVLIEATGQQGWVARGNTQKVQ